MFLFSYLFTSIWKSQVSKLLTAKRNHLSLVNSPAAFTSLFKCLEGFSLDPSHKNQFRKAGQFLLPPSCRIPQLHTTVLEETASVQLKGARLSVHSPFTISTVTRSSIRALSKARLVTHSTGCLHLSSALNGSC